MKRILCLLAITTTCAFGQMQRVDDSVTTAAKNVPAGAQAQVMTVPYAKISICGNPNSGSPCQNTVPVFADAAGTQALTQPLIADAQGRYGFFISPGIYTRSYQSASGTDLGTLYLTIAGPYGIIIADNLPGVDIGDKINAAFAAGAGTSASPKSSALVELSPGMTYSYSTTWVLPNRTTAPYIIAPVLDCHGSILTYTGSGEGFTILGANELDSGAIRNCFFSFSNPAATAHLWSRTFLKMTNLVLNLGTTGLTVINDLAHGGPGYTEEQHWSNIQVSVPTNGIGISFANDPAVGGAGSFFYNFFEGFHFDLGGNAHGFHLKSSTPNAVMFGGNIQAHANLNAGSNNAVLYLEDATVITRGTVDLSGEFTGATGTNYDVFTAGSSSFNNFGKSYIPGTVHGYGSAHSYNQFQAGLAPVVNDLDSGLGTITLSGEAGGTLAQRQCKNTNVNGNTYYYLASNGGVEVDCVWAVLARDTDNTNPDVDIRGTGTPITSVMFADPITKSVGIGPGFSAAGRIVSGRELSKPRATEEIRGSWMIADTTKGTSADGGVFYKSYIDTSGNVINYFQGGTSGQPSYHSIQMFRDYVTLAPVTGIDCFASTLVSCKVPELTLAASTSACSSTTPGKINYIAGTTGVKDTVQVCAKDAADAYAYRTIY